MATTPMAALNRLGPPQLDRHNYHDLGVLID
jgi:hypothetical protein